MTMMLVAVTLLQLFLVASSFVVRPQRSASISSTLFASSKNAPTAAKPRLIVFDLDGNLWRPEMYELAWDGMGHAPFEVWNNDPTKMKSQLNTLVRLIGDVPDLLDEFVLSDESSDTQLAISSRTDVPEWAEELLEKFTLPKSGKTLKECIAGPWEIRGDSKISHFQRLAKNTGIPMQDMVFFDNESGNCRQVASLGVTVGYCPNGVKRGVWDNCMAAFPNTDGSVIGM